MKDAIKKILIKSREILVPMLRKTGQFAVKSLQKVSPFAERMFEKVAPRLEQWLANITPKSDLLDSSTNQPGSDLGKMTIRTFLKRLQYAVVHFDYERFIDTIFVPENRQAIHQGFIVALIIGTAYVGGKVTALVLRGDPAIIEPRANPISVPTISNPKFRMEQVKLANLFHAETGGEILEKEGRTSKAIICFKADSQTSLPIELVNTVVLQESVKSAAAVSIRGSEDFNIVREGDDIGEMANIGKIERLRVVIKNLSTGQCEYISNKDYLASSAKTISILSPEEGKPLLERKTTLEGLRNEGNAYYLPKKILADQIKNLPGLLTQARAIPIMNPDGSMSFKVTDLQPGSIFALLGIDDNDIITKVNSKPITNINMIMDMLAGMDKMQKLELDINKDGTIVKKEYNFTQ